MSRGYPKVAIEFQQSIHKAALFRVHDYPDHLPLRGQTLSIESIILTPNNPDDHLYECKDDNRTLHEIRGWWLRWNCERVD